MKFKVLKVYEGMGPGASVDVKYGNGRRATFSMLANEKISEKAKECYKSILRWERERKEAVEYAKQFEGGEFSF